jgi:hypothetical protein
VKVLTVDLRDKAVRESARTAAPGLFLSDGWERLTGEAVSLVDAPFRLLVLMPMSAELAQDSESIAAAILGSDPTPRAIGLLLPAGDEIDVWSRVIPDWFTMGGTMRFIEMRSPLTSVGTPRAGTAAVSAGASGAWTKEFREDVLGHLTDPELFDAAWNSIPENRPVAVGLRIVSLGGGRSRAVADLALRLAEELDPDREPETANDLPERWKLDQRLLPINPPFPRDPDYLQSLPSPIRGLAAVRRGNPIAIVSRSVAQYEEAVELGVRMLVEEPTRLKQLLDGAERSRGEDPHLDPVGASILEKEFPGAVFGDSLAKEYAERDDAASRVGDLLSVAADTQADGLSASLLAHWFQSDAETVKPKGARAVSPRIVAASQPWAQLSRAINEVEPATLPARTWPHWLLQFVLGGPEMTVKPLPAQPVVADEPPLDNPEKSELDTTAALESDASETDAVLPATSSAEALDGLESIQNAMKSMEQVSENTSSREMGPEPETLLAKVPPDGAKDPVPLRVVDTDGSSVAELPESGHTAESINRVMFGGSAAAVQMITPLGHRSAPWRIPLGLGFIFGSFIWRRRSRAYLFTAGTMVMIVAAIAQIIADLTGIHLVNPTVFGIGSADSALLTRLVLLLAVHCVTYFVISMIGALAVAQWAEAFRFHEIPDTLALLRADARAIAQAEAGRITPRRDYARFSTEAGNTMIDGARRGAETAKEFGESVPVDETSAIRGGSENPPHRRTLGASDVLSGTDAAGIYRVYRLYVIALRQLFALSLVSAVKERWPRIRGTYWQEAKGLVVGQASAHLRDRLATVLSRGLLRGDLLRDGVDPAEQVAARIWSDPAVRSAALSAMTLSDTDAMPVLATTAETRLLDLHQASNLVVSIPSTLEQLLAREDAMPLGTIVASRSLEEVAVFRFYPYQEGIYRVEAGPSGEVGIMS